MENTLKYGMERKNLAQRFFAGPEAALTSWWNQMQKIAALNFCAPELSIY
ncbi:hypothetical protein QUF90_05570 [Desulfococcaceae bacterium HSG9]|nr:hypothetical protein [Desulfococcaceae bacterium HSG9]